MAQLVTRIDEALALKVDEMILSGVAENRSELVRLGLEQMIDRFERERTGAAIADAYARIPQSESESAGLDSATRALVNEEPW
ncbi:unannotated protein [freshwater metagenome]|uniref:Unannotated protein n=1 Tax=freshwater metagenome TaxID=449393 RepID=A0A6J6XKZ7_9ZZZZ|nr:hypothetical protein [Actinomycetota bacterium]